MKKVLLIAGSTLAKSRVESYVRKDGTFVSGYDNGRPAAAPKRAAGNGKPANPDHGHMRFTFKDAHGGEHRLHVNSQRIAAAGGPDMKSPMSLSNYMFRHGSLGTAEKNKLFTEKVRNAYNESGGDQQKVLDAIREVTKIGHGMNASWSVHSHDKPKTAPAAAQAPASAPAAAKPKAAAPKPKKATVTGKMHHRDVNPGDTLVGPDGKEHVIAAKQKGAGGRTKLKTEAGGWIPTRSTGHLPDGFTKKGA